MKKSSTEYAESLIIDYCNIPACDIYNGITWKMAIQCAIKDVESTIDYIKSDEIVMSVLGDNAPDLIYFTEALNHLKSKV